MGFEVWGLGFRVYTSNSCEQQLTDCCQRERVLKAQVAAERLELKQQLQDIDISRIKRERQRAADMRHAFRAAEERLRSSIKHR